MPARGPGCDPLVQMEIGASLLAIFHKQYSREVCHDPVPARPKAQAAVAQKQKNVQEDQENSLCVKLNMFIHIVK